MRRSSALVIAALVAIIPAEASAYCRTSSCPNVGTSQVCTPAGTNDCGVALFWPSPCVGYSLDQAASKKVDLETATKIFDAAFATWENADCGGGMHPRISLSNMGPVSCHKHEYNQNAGNANIILFRDDAWPYAGSANTLALTTVTYNLDTGEIYDADMELNSANTDLTTTDTGVEYDLASIAQHETGHFLGLAHSSIVDATMYPDYTKGSTSLRSLSADDIAAICATYPPGSLPDPCDPTPRHGFSAQCADQQTPASSGCSSSPSTNGSLAFATAALMAAAAAVSRSRSRRRS